MTHTYPLKANIRNLSAQLAKVTVLIADADMQIARLVRDVLNHVGFVNVIIVKSGAEAQKKLREGEIDLVITDWDMEPLSGIEFIEYVRTSPESPNRFLPIIMLTAHGERRDVEVARDTGVTEFVVKPFNAKVLFERLVEVIENPRSFIVSGRYKGPDRRRRSAMAPGGEERRARKID